MKYAVLTLAIALPVLAASAQVTQIESKMPIPTYGQCIADSVAWGNSFQIIQTSNDLSADELLRRQNEMLVCSKDEQASLYQTLYLQRVSDYLLRHRQWDSFRNEDMQGIRGSGK